MANGGEALRGALGEAAPPAGIAGSSAGARSESPLRQAIHRLRKSTTAVIGVVIVAALLLVALFADALAPQSPIANDQTRTFARPSFGHPLGTDQLRSQEQTS